MLKKPKSPEHEAESAHRIDKQPSIDTKDDELEDVQDWLAERLREGDRAAAARLVEMYYQPIFLYMRRLGHDRQESEDLTQESFLNAWYHIGQLKDGKALASWLYRIASNVSRRIRAVGGITTGRCTIADQAKRGSCIALYAAFDDCRGGQGRRDQAGHVQEQT